LIIEIALEVLIRVMPWWIQRATKNKNKSRASRARNPTKATIPPSRTLYVKRILTWKSLARKTKKMINLSTFQVNMSKSLMRKKRRKVTKRRRKNSNRSKTSRSNSK